MMNQCVTDTTGLIRHLAGSKNQGKNASKIFADTDSGICVVLIPVMVLMEILYLSEKNRISTTLFDVIQLVQDSTNYRIYPITDEVVLKAKEIVDIPELHDRVIAATAALLGHTLDKQRPCHQSICVFGYSLVDILHSFKPGK